MEVLEGLWLIARGVYHIGKYLLGGAKWLLGWAVAHPLGAIAVSGGVYLGSLWLENQPWAGADTLAGLTGLLGETLFTIGVGAWIAHLVGGAVWKGIKAVGVFLRPGILAVPGHPGWDVFPRFTGPLTVM